MSNSKIADFFATAGIYNKLDITVENRDELEKIINGSTRYSFDLYCPKCKSNSVFSFSDFETYWRSKGMGGVRIVGTGLSGFANSLPQMVKSEEEKYKELISNNKLSCICAHCSREISHEFFVFFTMDNNCITKVGQHPNVIQFQYNKVSKYEKLLGKYSIELKTALNLHAHGVGVGSYVYLRRIFENILFEKFISNSDELNIDKNSFQVMRFEEKIDCLKKYLPDFIIKNKTIYSILSKGIHELDEEECNTYFETLFQSITMILDEIIEQKEKECKQSNLTDSIAKIKGYIGKK